MESKMILMVALALFAVVAVAPLAQATCTPGYFQPWCAKTLLNEEPCPVFVPPQCYPYE